ncbi:MAG: protein-glutamate O-methyltransferase CheR [Thermoguttaceae bacterium]|nr:protein-glutamate O-methyltransferase CheR [Thermoguttaceae bacterium]MDW8078747.1 protein-glutamate O-methyltransferase CheR [Thermoguttaceae bacterium]
MPNTFDWSQFDIAAQSGLAGVTSIWGPAPLSDAQMDRYTRLVYERTGIRISPQKKMLLANRLRRRIRETGLPDFEAYYRYLSNLPSGHPEWDAFYQEITTHETYLFRDENQWRWFRQVFLKEVQAAVTSKRRPRELDIWSAACSTGDEPVTIACCIAAVIPTWESWTIRILGTDIGLGALEEAKAGIYDARAMRLVPEDYRRRFFIPLPDGRWKVKPALLSRITYRQHNLLHPLPSGAFDLVFLKNVLIYFDAHSKRRALENLVARIKPGGYLVTGPAEGVGDVGPQMVRQCAWLFRKTPGPTTAEAVSARSSQPTPVVGVK